MTENVLSVIYSEESNMSVAQMLLGDFTLNRNAQWFVQIINSKYNQQ